MAKPFGVVIKCMGIDDDEVLLLFECKSKLFVFNNKDDDDEVFVLFVFVLVFVLLIRWPLMLLPVVGLTTYKRGRPRDFLLSFDFWPLTLS